MLSLGKFSSQPLCNYIILHRSVSKMFVLPTKTHLTQFSFSPNGMIRLGCCGVFARKGTGFCIYAAKNQRKGGNDLLEMDGFEDFDEDDDFLEDEEGGLEEGEGYDDEFIPLNNMKKWLKNKPSGFGEGKVYNTSIEDKLMEEIEQSRTAQLANINKLKNNPLQPNVKKEGVQKEKDGFQVRLVNLPKKKNIHRDLQLAFKGVSGIVDIVPLVSRNKRTRDPISKGLAFIRFRSENDAYRFVQSFTGKSIVFGKVQKQIKCEMTTGILDRGYEQFAEETSYNAQPAEHHFGSSTEDVSVEFHNQDKNEMHESTHSEDDGEDLEPKGQLESKWDGNRETKEESIHKSSSSMKNKEKIQEKDNKVASQRKRKNIQKFNIPGSANRLKIREKEVLTGVFSKYGANASLATREQS